MCLHTRRVSEHIRFFIRHFSIPGLTLLVSNNLFHILFFQFSPFPGTIAGLHYSENFQSRNNIAKHTF